MTELYFSETSSSLNSYHVNIQHDSPDKLWIEACLKRFNGYPNLEQLWKLMDEVWLEFGCDKDLSEANLRASPTS